MREAEENSIWSEVKLTRRKKRAREITSAGLTLDLQQPLTVLGGRSGVGKSRTLRGIKKAIVDSGGSALLVDLNRLCQLIHGVLVTRDDLKEMREEYDSLGPFDLRLNDVQRVVGRDYEELGWYSLEFEIADPAVAAALPWVDGEEDPSLVPYFETTYRGIEYSSVDMGQGELAVHLLFWILEISRDKPGLVLLLDEPDAYLPPVAARALVARLLRICKERQWSIVLSTHKSEVIEWAIAEDAFFRVRVDEGGASTYTHNRDDEHAGLDLLAQDHVSQVFYVEDESALHLTRALMDSLGPQAKSTTSVIWAKGEGNLRRIRDALPGGAHAPIQYAFIADGDQRKKIPASKKNQWPMIFLPDDPDVLFVAAGNAERDKLAVLLNTDRQSLDSVLEPHEGGDAHDWVNGLGAHFGREASLKALAHLWVNGHSDAAEAWVKELTASVAF